MRIIDADKFLAYLIFSKHIDGLTCGEVKEAIEMSKVDVLDKIRAEIEEIETYDGLYIDRAYVLQIIDKYKGKAESEDEEGTKARDDLNDMKKDDTIMVMSQGKWRCTQCNQLHFNTKSTKPRYCSNCGRKVKEYIK